MTRFESLVTKNPMTVEIRRATRRFLTFSGPSGTVTMGLLLWIILYAILFLLVVNLRGEFHPKIVLGIQLFVAALVAPITLHASIAGERERRSWDMLMVAPVTHAQVIVGKLLGGLAVQVAIAAAMLFPTLVAAVTYAGTDGLSLYGLVRLELVALTAGAFCSALTMLISARVKRAFVALGVSGSALLLLFAFLPVVLAAGSVGAESPEMRELLYGWHPVTALLNIDAKRWDGSERISTDTGFTGFFPILLCAGFTVVFTMWTVRTVAFADNEVRFLPGQRKGARTAMKGDA